MSMTGRLRMVSKEEKVQADNNVSLFKDMIFDSSGISVEDWWDQLWFIYHVWMQDNSVTGVPNPSYQKLQSKEFEIGKDLGYGKPHYLTPEQVIKISDFLDATEPETLVKYALTQKYNDILYPHDWPEEMQPDHSWIIGYMNSLREYYRKAVDANAGMLQVIT